MPGRPPPSVARSQVSVGMMRKAPITGPVVVLGGLGSVAGAYAGGMIVGVVESFAGYYIDPELKQAVWFLIFLAVLVFRPSGLFGQVGAEEVGMREQT